MEHSPPFSEQDKRLIVTQAIKTSTIPLDRLAQLFDEYNTEPDWTTMELPYRRTVQECQDVFANLRPSPLLRQETPGNFNKRKSGQGLDISPGGFGASNAKRRQSVIFGVEKEAQRILPKPMSGASSPSMTIFPASVQPAKRRGRPPKSEVERRNQEAIARGEVLAPHINTQPVGPIHFSQPETYNTPGYPVLAPAPSAMYSPSISTDERRTSFPESSSAAQRRPQSSPKSAKRDPPPLHPGQHTFSAHTAQTFSEGREGLQSPAPREGMQTVPIVVPRVDKPPDHQRIPAVLADGPPVRPVAEAAGPLPTSDPPSSK